MKIRTINLTVMTILNVGAFLASCTAAGLPVDLANDCSVQSATIRQATTMVDKLTITERNAIDADIALSKMYCAGTLPADQKAASKAVQASTAKMAAVLGVAALR
jgi:hypothetical protein